MTIRFDPSDLDETRFPINEWVWSEARYDGGDLGVTETLFTVSNGYLGLRGNVEEGRDSYAQGTFINGFHEIWPIRHAEDAYGFAKVGQTIINAPDAKVLRLYVDDEPLLLAVAELEEYERTLDFREGLLRRDLIWRTPSGKRVKISSKRLVSFSERHLAALTYEVTLLDEAAPVVVSSQLLNRQDGQDEYNVPDAAMGEGFDPRQSEQLDWRVLVPQLSEGHEGRYILGYRVANSKMTLAVGTDHHIETDNSFDERHSLEDDLVKHVYRIDAQPGVPISITKVVTYHSSRGVPARELADRCERTLDRVKQVGLDEIFEDQRRWLDRFWDNSDVVIQGQPRIQQAVRWCLYQLAGATARAEGSGIPAKGLTGSGYSGHYFWDTEIYVLPFLTYTYPAAAHNALRFRYHMLEHARKRAQELNQAGALYPWRTINGEEASAYYAAGTAQYHIDADIAYALTQYVHATGDVDFLASEGIDVLVETARMWADLGFWRGSPDSAFHIHGVTGPDEYTTVVNDNLFTNVMARSNLRNAVRAVNFLRENRPEDLQQLFRRLQVTDEEVQEWNQAAEGMFIPFDEGLGIHPQDVQFLEKELWDLENTDPEKRPLLLHFHPLVIYRYQVLKQADVVLALFLQGDQFTLEEKRRDFEYYDPLTTGDSTLSAVVQSIIAAEVGYADLALEYFHAALFVDLADLHHNAADGVHVASTGGIWSALVSGFGGMRDARGRITFDPRLPQTWEGLEFKLLVRGRRIQVRLDHETIELSLVTGNPLTIGVRGTEYEIGEEPTVIELEATPRIPGAPTVGDIEGGRRADGTVLTASVPVGGEHTEE